MEWSERMNAAIGYIEENLAGEIDFTQAAEKACCSLFHFQRMFMIIIGFTPSEYARHRRLTLAARELTAANAKVIDLAVKYGYDSPDSFTRAFRNVHGITPQAAREPGVTLTAFPCISFNITLRGGIDMDYRIVEKPAFDVMGRGRKFTTKNMVQAIKIPQFWQEFLASPEDQTLDKLNVSRTGPITGGMSLGVIMPYKKDACTEEVWDPIIYAICIEKSGKIEVGDFDEYHIPAATWAVFDCTLPTIQDTTRRIFQEWFPSTGYEHDMKPEIEVYFPENPKTKVMRCQIWIPIVKKKKAASTKKK
jgi:AraC family transcriptional regulator